MRSRKTEDRIRAVQRLAARADADTAEILLTTLDDPSAYVGRLAADELAQVATWEICDRLTERFRYFAEDGFRRDPGCFIRTSLAFALGKCEYAPAVDLLIDGIRTVQIEPLADSVFDMACQLRASCAMSLAEIRAPNAIEEIMPLLFDTGLNRVDKPEEAVRTNPEVRSVAARALARLGSPAGLMPLSIKLLFPDEEKEPDVTTECMSAAAAVGGESALRYLKPYLRHANTTFVAHAALAISTVRASDAHMDILMAIGRVSGNLLTAVVLALTTIRSVEAEAALIGLKDSPRGEVRLALVEVLSVRGDDESGRILAVMARADANQRVRERAAAALKSKL